MKYRKSKKRIDDLTTEYLTEQAGDRIDRFDEQLETIRNWIERLSASIPDDASTQGAANLEAYQALLVAVEELSVAGEELRQQNEQLIESRELMEESRRKYEDLFELAPDGYIVTDLYGKIEEANQAACQQFHLPKTFLLGKPLTPLIARNHRPAFIDKLISIRTGERDNLDIETRIQPRRSSPLDVAITVGLMRNQQNELEGIRWLIHDIHDRREFEAKLYESEVRFHTIFGEAEVGIVILNLSGEVQVVNPALLRMLEIPEQALTGRPFLSFIQEDDLEVWKAALEALVKDKQDRQRLQVCLLTRDGAQVAARLALSLVRTAMGKPDYVILIADNISDEKQMEQELINVEGRLTDVADHERVRLAQDLHDGPLQDLYGILYQLKMVSLGKVDEAAYTDLDRAQSMLQQTIDQLRDTTGGLRPPTLAHFGLERAIRSYVDSIADITSEMKIQLDLQNDEGVLSERVRTALFRIYQQCMMNVIRHSRAHLTQVRLRLGKDEIFLEVKDDGVGFAVPRRWMELIAGGHYGLVGAAERAISIGGRLHILSSPGQGTLMRVIIPRRAEDQVQKERLPLEILDWKLSGPESPAPEG